jgi:hypothetical protein
VSRPGILSSLRRKVLELLNVVDRGAQHWVQRMRLCARVVASSQAALAVSPTNWPWRDAFETALVRIAAIPAPT